MEVRQRWQTGADSLRSLCQGDVPQGRKDRRLNIRLSSKDLEAIQKRALPEGLPYQTLIASLLHKYAAGRLREVQPLYCAAAKPTAT
jgi:hypothetical protein